MAEFKRQNGDLDERRFNRAEAECRTLERMARDRRPRKQMENGTIALIAQLRQKLEAGEKITEEEFTMLGSRIALNLMESENDYLKAHGVRLSGRMYGRVKYAERNEKRMQLAATRGDRELKWMKEKLKLKKKLAREAKKKKEGWLKDHAKGLALP